jgi:hypothetical protein
MPKIRQGKVQGGQKVGEEPVRELNAGFRLIVIQNLPDLPNRQPVIQDLHADLPISLMNSSCVRQQEGSRSISSLRRSASAKPPSSSSGSISGSESSRSAASFARWDSGSAIAMTSISASVAICQIMAIDRAAIKARRIDCPFLTGSLQKAEGAWAPASS